MLTQIPKFWKQVRVEKISSAYQVLLDNRPLKTPKGKQLLFPEEDTALLVANEWDDQEVVLKPHSLPLTSVFVRAIDSFADQPRERENVVESLDRFLGTDTLCFPHDHPESLVKAQKDIWDPILKLIKDKLNVKIQQNSSITIFGQSEPTRQKLLSETRNMSDIELAVMEKAVMNSKSYLIGLALVKSWITVEHSVRAAMLEADVQAKRWGELEDAHVINREDMRRQLGALAAILMTRTKRQ